MTSETAQDPREMEAGPELDRLVALADGWRWYDIRLGGGEAWCQLLKPQDVGPVRTVVERDGEMVEVSAPTPGARIDASGVPIWSSDDEAAAPLLTRHRLALVPSEDGWYCIKPEDIEHGHTRGTDEPRLSVIGCEGESFPLADTPALAIARCVALLSLESR